LDLGNSNAPFLAAVLPFLDLVPALPQLMRLSRNWVHLSLAFWAVSSRFPTAFIGSAQLA